MQQQIKPFSGGVELIITDDNDDTFTIRFHCPPNGELNIEAKEDGTFSMKSIDSNGNEHPLGIDPSGGSKQIGK